MSVFLAWTDARPVVAELEGPWLELREAAPGLLLIESVDSLSTVYHALKWSLPEGGPLIVAPLDRTPKLRGLAPGTTSWLRSRTAT